MKIPIVKNTLTNFISMFVRLIQGILIARWLIADLGEDQYGLWSMLWVFFSFALLLDLGFGVTAQKATATEMWRHDIRKYNTTISSIFCAHVAMSALLIPIVILAAVYARELFHLPPGTADLAYYRICIILSGLGAAVVFPLGVFPEILVGLHKLYLRNYVHICAKILEFIGVLLIFYFHGGLIVLIIFSIILVGCCTQIAMMIAVYRSIPGLRVLPRFNREALRGIFEFSSSAYLISMGRLIWERGGPLLLSIFCGLTPVGLFQLGSRIPMLVQQLAMPCIENISPIAARLHARNHHKDLADIQNHLIRQINFLAAGITAGVLLAAPKLLYILFHVNSPRTVLICRLMMFLIYGILIFRLIPEKSLTMAGGHRFLAVTLLCEDLLFLAVALTALWFRPSELSLVLAMLFTKGIITALVIAPNFFHRYQISLRRFILQNLLAPPAAAAAAAAVSWIVFSSMNSCCNEWLSLAAAAMTGGLLYLTLLYACIFNRMEKMQVHAALARLNLKFKIQKA